MDHPPPSMGFRHNGSQHEGRPEGAQALHRPGKVRFSFASFGKSWTMT
jgi:hypothetical protein